MTLLDVVLVLALGLSAAAGLRVGLLVRAAGIGGIVTGLALSMGVVPFVTSLAEPATLSGALVVTALTVALTVLVSMIVLQVAAFRLRGRIDDEDGLRNLDRIGGAAVGAIAVLGFVWITTPLAARVPGVVAAQVRGSAVVALVDDITPDAPNPFGALEAFVASTRFPEVFTDIAPARTSVDPPTEVPIDPVVVQRAAASSVRVDAAGCGARYSGSGWVVGPDTVVTNAHVIVGATELTVVRPDGIRVSASVVALGADSDLALLEAPGLGLVPLPRGSADDGELAATFGHPLGQDELRVAPARIDRTVTATGRDIYGSQRVTRRVVVVAATLTLGDSGSPVVDDDGTVVGTVFAISPDDDGTAYALADSELASLLAAGRAPGLSGSCP